MIMFPKDGLPYYLTESLPPDMLALLAEGEAATPADAVRLVDEQIAQVADIVKPHAVSWLRRGGKIVRHPMPLAVVKAVTKQAHRKGKLVIAHPSTIEGVELVIAGHVDVLAQTSEGSMWDAALSARLKKANVTLIPTPTLFSRDDEFDSILREVKSYSDPRPNYVWHRYRLSDRFARRLSLDAGG
jgi:hypothetical protein